MRLLLSGTENYSQSLGTSLHSSLFLSHLSERSALAALPRADQSAANGSPMPCHSSAGSLKSIRRFMVDLGGGKKKPICRRDHIFSVSPFVLYVLRTKAAQAGGGEQAVEGMKSHETKAPVVIQIESKFGEGGEHRSCVPWQSSGAGALLRREKRRRNAVEVFLQALGAV